MSFSVWHGSNPTFGLYLQSGDHADDPVMEGYLDLLATDKSKVRSCHGMPASRP